MKSQSSKGPGTPGPFFWVPASIASDFAFMHSLNSLEHVALACCRPSDLRNAS
jgi:hypothetical protein